MKKTLIYACLFLILSSFAIAGESFIVSQIPSSLNVISCSTGTTSLIVFDTTTTQQISTYIINGGEATTTTEIPIPSTYTIILSGEAAKWVTAVPNRFTINSGEQQQANLFWNIPCGATSESLTATVQTDSGLSQSFDTKLIVSQASNLRLIPLKNSYDGCPCKTMKFSYLIQNTGDFTERYEISTDTFGARASENPIVLGKGQSKQVSVYVDAACDSYGKSEGTFKVSAAGSGMAGQTLFYMNVLGCNNYNAYFGEIQATEGMSFKYLSKGYSACEGEEPLIPIMFRNTGDSTNTYKLNVDRSASLSTEQLKLGTNESEEVFVKLAGLKNGNYAIPLHILTEIGNVESTITIPVAVENCNTPQMNIPNKININHSSQTNNFYIQNTGTRKATYTLTISGAAFASVEPTSLTVEAGGQGTISIVTKPFIDQVTGSYPTTVIAKSDGREYKHDLTIVLGEQESNLLSTLMLYKWYLLAGLGVLVLLIVILLMGGRKKPQEPVVEEEQKIEKVYKTIAEERRAALEAERHKRQEERQSAREERQAEIISRREARLEERRVKLEEKQKARIKKKPVWVTIVFIIFVLALLGAAGYMLYKYYKVPAQPDEGTNITGANPSFTIGGSNETEQPTKAEPNIFSRAYHKAKDWFWNYFRYIMIGIGALVFIIILSIIYYKIKNKMMILWVLLSLAIIAGLIVAFIYLRPIISKAKPVENITTTTNVSIPETPKYQQDAMLKALLNGKYGYNALGDVVEIESGRRVKAQEYVDLLKENSEPLIESGIDAQEIQATIKAFENLALREGNETASINQTITSYANETSTPSINETSADDFLNCTLTTELNQPITINLSKSFYDPDSNLLTYSAVESENVKVNIDRDMAQLVPRQGFTGESEIEFNTVDNLGGSASSGIVRVCVKNPETKGLYQRAKGLVGAYLLYIIVGVLILAVLIFAIKHYESKQLPKPKKRR